MPTGSPAVRQGRSPRAHPASSRTGGEAPRERDQRRDPGRLRERLRGEQGPVGAAGERPSWAWTSRRWSPTSRRHGALPPGDLDLIVSMAKDKVSRVKAILDRAPNARVGRSATASSMRAAPSRSARPPRSSRATRCSRSTQVTQRRHGPQGITRYVWRTSGDGDVRPAHHALDGRRSRTTTRPWWTRRRDAASTRSRTTSAGAPRSRSSRGSTGPRRWTAATRATSTNTTPARPRGSSPREGTGGAAPRRQSRQRRRAQQRDGDDGQRSWRTGDVAVASQAGRRGGSPRNMASTEGGREFANSRARRRTPRSRRERRGWGRWRAARGETRRAGDECGQGRQAIGRRLACARRACPDRRVAALGQGTGRPRAGGAHAEGLSELDAALDGIGRGRAKVWKRRGVSRVHPGRRYVKPRRRCAPDLDKRKTAVEGSRGSPDGTRAYVSLKCHAS